MYVVRRKYGTAEDPPRIQWATHIFCLSQLVKLDSSVREEIGDALEFE